jgi:hypothetical protein
MNATAGAARMLYSRLLRFRLNDRREHNIPLKTWPSDRRAVEAAYSTVR